MSAAPEQEPEAAWTGAWASDAQRLFRMLQQAADRAAADSGRDTEADTDAAHLHATAAECKYCPVCQGLAMIRRSGPDVLDKVAEFASGLAATLRAADRDRPPADAGHTETGQTETDDADADDSETMDVRDARTAEPDTSVMSVIPRTTHIEISD